MQRTLNKNSLKIFFDKKHVKKIRQKYFTTKKHVKKNREKYCATKKNHVELNNRRKCLTIKIKHV